MVDTDNRHVHQVGRPRPGRGCHQVAGCLGVAPGAGRAVDDGRRCGHGLLDALAGPQVCGEESDALRDGPVVPGEHADVTTAVLQPGDDKLPEAAGATSDKDGRGHGLSLRQLALSRGVGYVCSL